MRGEDPSWQDVFFMKQIHLDGVMYVDKVEGKLLDTETEVRNSEDYIYGDS